MQTSLELVGGTDLRAWLANPNPGGGYALRDDEIIIDSFAGAGGMSMGIEEALGRSPDVAINHWDVAIETHEANHPETKHYHASVYAIDPREMVPSGKKVGLLWASPDCRHFSRAKNGSPKSTSVRMLASCVVHYAHMIKASCDRNGERH